MGNLAIGALIALILWTIILLGGLVGWDGYFYDLMFRATRPLAAPPARVVLVAMDPDSGTIDAPTALKTIENLAPLKPSGIIFNVLPKNLTITEYRQMEKYGNVFLGLHVNMEETSWRGGAQNRLQIPDILKHGKIKYGITCLPSINKGIIRMHQTHSPIDRRYFPTLETVVSMVTLPKDSKGIKMRMYRINFRGGAGSLPLVTLDRVLNNDLVRSLIEGKWVLIGRGEDSSLPGIAAASTSGGQTMSFLEFQGHSLNTLLNRKMISETPRFLVLLIFLVLALANHLIYRRLYMKMASWVTLLFILFYGGVAFFLFISFRVWVPMGHLVLLQFALFFISIRNKNVTADRAFQTLLMDLNAKLRERYYPTSIYLVKEHWKQVVAMVVQTLSINRLIFLERLRGDHRLREVESYRCLLSDIDERRRDYLRPPYSDAIQNNGPILLEKNRLYLKSPEENEEQYLVPLSFAGNILGFWGFGIKTENRVAIPNFFPLVRDYGFIISELLYNRQEVQEQENRSFSLWEVLTREREKEAHAALNRTIELLKHQFDNLARVFFNLATMAIVYDLFGRVLEVNEKMLGFLKSEGLAPYNISLLDFFSMLTKTTIDEARKILRSVINERKSHSFIVNRGNKNYILSLKPLEFKGGFQTRIDPAPFGINGVVCELSETPSMIRLHEIREKLAAHLNSSLQVELDGLGGIIRALGKGDLPGAHQRELLALAENHLDKAFDSIENCEIYLSESGDAEEYSTFFPINPEIPLLLAIDAIEPITRKKRLRIDINRPDSIKNVMALPEYLHHVFVHILTVLAGDSIENGTITVDVFDEENWIVFNFQDKGPGVPMERLQEKLSGKSEGVSIEWRNLQGSFDWVRTWGGKVDSYSEPGCGIRFTLKLSTYI